LLKKNRIRTVHGHATMLDGKTCRVETDIGPQTIRAEHVLLATGSEPVELPFLPFGGRVISSTEALSLPQVPARMAVVGAGYIGLELGMAFATLGTKVTVVEATERILPRYDAELTHPVLRRMEALGIALLAGAVARGVAPDGEALLVTTADGAERRIPSDAILVAVGRRPCTQGFGLERLDLTMNGPFIRIDDRCATSMRNVWAVGDVTGEPMLAHRAMAQGEMVAEIIAGERRVFDHVAIPDICFTTPEIVAVGLSPSEARGAGWEIRLGHFPFSANGRAMTMNAEEGFVRVVARADNHLVLGLQAVGHGVSELAAAFGLALEMGARLEDVADTIHAHPTQGEAIQEAARKALGRVLHM
jgi:dihydrolipoamide dehydrogenase